MFGQRFPRTEKLVHCRDEGERRFYRFTSIVQLWNFCLYNGRKPLISLIARELTFSLLKRWLPCGPVGPDVSTPKPLSIHGSDGGLSLLKRKSVSSGCRGWESRRMPPQPYTFYIVIVVRERERGEKSANGSKEVLLLIMIIIMNK